MGKGLRNYKEAFGGAIDTLITLTTAALRSKISCALPKATYGGKGSDKIR